MIDKLVVKFMVFKMWLADDHGQDVLEYAMLSGLIAIVLLALVATGTLTTAVEAMAGGISRCIDFDKGTNCVAGF